MILRQAARLYSSVGPLLVDVDLPLVVELASGRATVVAGETDAFHLLVIERTVRLEALQLQTETGVRYVGSDEQIPLIEVDASGIDGPESAWDVASALSFLTDRPFEISAGPEGPELVAETTEDEQLLRTWGTRKVWWQFEGRASVRTFSEPITPELVAALLPKSVGLQLYADAIRHSSQRARYRELWLVLESAFALEGRDLTTAIAAFGPAAELDFTADELEDLRTYRGRASHAASRAGMTELRHVRSDTAEREGRLKTLVERVVLTKKVWGSPTLEVEELAKLKAWTARDKSA
jgi:hypothetical protein